MLIKPDLADEDIVICLRDAYGLGVKSISFLPIGADFNTAVYRVMASSQKDYFHFVERTEKLALTLQKQPLEYILCHADIHGWNLIVDKEGTLYIVDWDTLIFALKERDLMFVGAGIWDSGLTATEEESLFYQGYGQTKINQDAICYYRFERIIQDIGEYCEYIFLSDEGGDDRLQCFEHLKPVFLPNGALERAYQTDKTRSIL